METFTLKVIGFSRVFYEGEAVQAQLPIQDGSMGIMAHHEAAVIGIVPGTMRLQTPDGEWQSAVVDAGFARVGENTVSVMVEEVLRPEEIDEERERRALAEATLELARELGPRNLRFNAVAPGPVLPPVGLEHSKMEKTLPTLPLRRKVELSDLAEAVLFLCRNDSITGEILRVDCGQHLG